MADQASGESSVASSSSPVPVTKSAGRFTVAPAEDDDERENGDDGESSPATTEGGATDPASSAVPPAVETPSDDGSDLWPNPTASSDEVATAAADEDDAAQSEVRETDTPPPHHLPVLFLCVALCVTCPQWFACRWRRAFGCISFKHTVMWWLARECACGCACSCVCGCVSCVISSKIWRHSGLACRQRTLVPLSVLVSGP
jgi:hypothetical protein